MPLIYNKETRPDYSERVVLWLHGGNHHFNRGEILLDISCKQQVIDQFVALQQNHNTVRIAVCSPVDIVDGQARGIPNKIVLE